MLGRIGEDHEGIATRLRGREQAATGTTERWGIEEEDQGKGWTTGQLFCGPQGAHGGRADQEEIVQEDTIEARRVELFERVHHGHTAPRAGEAGEGGQQGAQAATSRGALDQGEARAGPTTGGGFEGTPTGGEADR